ncbi:MAG: hydrolase [Thiohalospira sp.]
MTTMPLLCRTEASQVVFVDLQGRLTAAMEAEERQQVLTRAGQLAHAAELLAIPRLVTRQYPEGLGDTDPELAPALAGATVVDKTRFSCCGQAAFDGPLADTGRSQIILAGMETHVCVTQTALELVTAGYTVFVAADATCSRDPQNRERGLARLARSGVQVTVTESVLFEWLRDAGHEHFKTISRWLR